jgi:DNA gyrase subunit B
MRGKPVSVLEVIGESNETGTSIYFEPDAEIFEEVVFEREVLVQRIRELSFLNKGLQIEVTDERDSEGYKRIFKSNGLHDFVAYINKNKEPIHEKEIYFDVKKEDVVVEIAIQYNNGYTENIYSFANNIRTQEGGTHEIGFKNALTR